MALVLLFFCRGYRNGFPWYKVLAISDRIVGTCSNTIVDSRNYEVRRF